MKAPQAFELPAELVPEWKRAHRLEWITLAYQGSVIVLLAMLMGSSQAMKTAVLEDLLSLLPAVSFLIASRFCNRPPSERFPYGLHRVFTVAFLAGSLALLAMGSFLLIDSVLTLVKADKPTIGSVYVLGHRVWQGWLMMAGLVYGAVPAYIIGRRKMPLAKALHSKILYADADSQRANYLTSIAAITGVLGIGFGLWWADAAAAILISVSVIRDGWIDTKNAVLDIIDRQPVHVDHSQADELVKELERKAETIDGVGQARARMSEHGQVYFGEMYIVPSRALSPEEVEDIAAQLERYHWKIYDVDVMPVASLPDFSSPDQARRRAG